MRSGEGIVTAAFGRRKYVEMAVDCCLSAMAVSRLPMSLVTDSAGASVAVSNYPGLFDHVIMADRNGDGIPSLYAASKLAAIKHSPYERSIFLDADVICIEVPALLLENVQHEDFRIFGRQYDRDESTQVRHHNIAIDELIRVLGLESYVYCSLYAFAFGSAGGMRVGELMEAEHDRWWRETRIFGTELYDELLLGVLGGRTKVSFFNIPSNGIQNQDLSFRWTDSYKFLHCAPMRYREGARVLQKIVVQRHRNGYPVFPAIFWMSDILTRRAVHLGLSRRTDRLVKWVAESMYAPAA